MPISKAIIDGLSENSPSISRINLSNESLNKKDILDLSNALKGNTNLSRISLKNNKLDDELIEIFAQVLPYTTITSLNLDNNKITLHGLIKLSNFLKESYVKELTLRGNLIDEACNDRLSLSTVIEGNSVLKILDLSDNKLAGLAKTDFFEQLQSNIILNKLSLEKANLGDDIGFLIAKLLQVNNSISFLNLSYNYLTDNSTVNIAFSLRKNTGLKTIWLKKNSISNLTLAEFIFVSQLNKGLTSINLMHNAISVNSQTPSILLSSGDGKNSNLTVINDQINFIHNKIKNRAISLLNISRILFNFSASATVEAPLLALPPEIKLMILEKLTSSLLAIEQVKKIISFGADKKTISSSTKEGFLNSIDHVKSAKPLVSPHRHLFFADESTAVDSRVNSDFFSNLGV
jgi:hypothetical protein